MTTAFKQIKIVESSRAAIEAALAAVNGRASGHTYTTAAEVLAVAAQAEARIAALRLPVAERPGAMFASASGESVAKAYKYSRIGTRIELVRRPAGWYLSAVHQATLYPGASMWADRLSLTREQDTEAVARLRNGYTVLHPAPVAELASA